MTPDLFLRTIIRPGLSFMADVLDERRLEGPAAEVMLLAIALQESGCRYRAQQPGPARGFWQFERNGGYRGVREHGRAGPMLKTICGPLNISLEEAEMWGLFHGSELLQLTFARLLLWSDSSPLPPFGHSGDAWAIYLRNWRPGKPRLQAWPSNYQQALDLVGKNAASKAAPSDVHINAARESLRQALTHLDAHERAS